MDDDDDDGDKDYLYAHCSNVKNKYIYIILYYNNDLLVKRATFAGSTLKLFTQNHGISRSVINKFKLLNILSKYI